MELCSLPGCQMRAECRCSVCKILYCSRKCQESHWPFHWRDCLPVPDLENIDPSKPIKDREMDEKKAVRHQQQVMKNMDSSEMIVSSRSPGEEIEAYVSYFETPSSGIFMLPKSNVQKLIDMMEALSLESSSSRNIPAADVRRLGTVCLVYDDQESSWNRAEITKFYESNENVEVFFIDHGKTVRVSSSKLRQLQEEFKSTPGLVFEIHLRGVEPGTGNKWTKEELQDAHKVLDSQTLFYVKDMKIIHGKLFANLMDSEGNDASALMVEIGCAGQNSLSGYTFTRNTLSPGTQKVIILNTVSTAEFYVCTEDQLEFYTSTVIPALTECAEDADYALTAGEGDIVIAKHKDHWYRARVIKIISNYQVKLLFLDVNTEKTLCFSDLKKASPVVYKYPILAVKCSIKSWKDFKDKSGKVTEKLKELLKKYEMIEFDVIGFDDVEYGNLLKSKDVEEHLENVRTSIELNSRFDILKAKFKTMSPS